MGATMTFPKPPRLPAGVSLALDVVAEVLDIAAETFGGLAAGENEGRRPEGEQDQKQMFQ